MKLYRIFQSFVGYIKVICIIFWISRDEYVIKTLLDTSKLLSVIDNHNNIVTENTRLWYSHICAEKGR